MARKHVLRYKSNEWTKPTNNVWPLFAREHIWSHEVRVVYHVVFPFGKKILKIIIFLYIYFSFRNQLSNAIFDPLPKSTMNEEPQNIEGLIQGCNQTTEESLQQWHQSTDELLSSLMTHDVTFSVTKVLHI